MKNIFLPLIACMAIVTANAQQSNGITQFNHTSVPVCNVVNEFDNGSNLSVGERTTTTVVLYRYD